MRASRERNLKFRCRVLTSCVLSFLAFLSPLAWCVGAETSIELQASCKDAAPCRVIDGMIDVELDLLNAGTDAVSLPVEYFRQQGPKVILVDNRSSKEKRLGMGPPRSYLFDQMQELAPGQAIRIPWSIPDHHISRFALRPVSITAIFRFYLAPGSSLPAKEFVSTQLLIEGD